MSYILDALKRAESERSRGQIPGLHAQPMSRVAIDLQERPPVWKMLLYVVIAVLVLGALAWWWLSGDGPAPAAVPPQAAPLAASPSTSAAPANPPAQVNAPAPVVVAVEPAASEQPKPTPRRNPPPAIKSVATPANAAAPARMASVPTPAPRSQTAADPSGATRSTAAPAPAASASASASGSTPEPRVLAMSELPADVISSLPALVVSGASYSDQPASRMVIINGALYREGDRLTSELTLQRISLRSAVLSFRGYRFSINY
jgi:general secretion pathway protein B